MSSIRWLLLNIPILVLSFQNPSFSQVKAPSKPAPPSAGIRVERRTPDDGMIITRYQDLRTGRMLIVKGGTVPEIAQLWLATLNEMKEEKETPYIPQMSKMVSTNVSKGLLGLVIYSEGVRLSVFSGALPGGNEAININAQDTRSGASVNLDGSASQEDGLAWLEVAKKAASEINFTTLLNANHAKGLTGITGVFDGIRVEALWQRK